MTSWRVPDYQAQITPTAEQLELIRGLTIGVKIKRPNKAYLIDGMIMVGEKSEYHEEKPVHVSFWLTSTKSQVPLNTPVTFTLIDNCNPMVQFEQATSDFESRLPIEIIGTVLSPVKRIEGKVADEVKRIINT
ncbi:hypothetical protein ACMAZF_04120 [Psychrobium sp. nBUS_13]|uniref:hypothetical protein n=1 Tax=Psychrobium sp. nBUS_13 TaxID=3395319 RepID=UPI003EB87399